jgi:tetratricopeptide (TPR) repeat protein
VSDHPRIEELRRRVQKDPASIAFAQLAEEFRRAGEYEEAVRVCRTGLATHPSYLSARVTLGRALIELEQYDEAQTELEYVLRSAPENLAAIRGLAEIEQRRGNLEAALRHFQTALGIAKHDPDLEESVASLTQQLGTGQARVEPPPIPVDLPAAAAAGTHAPAPAGRQAARAASPELDAAADEFTKALQALDALSVDLPMPDAPNPAPPAAPPAVTPPPIPEPPVQAAPAAGPAPDDGAVNELEAWLDAIVIDRDSNKKG